MLRQIWQTVTNHSGEVARASLRTSRDLFGYTTGVVRRSFSDFPREAARSTEPSGSRHVQENFETSISEEERRWGDTVSLPRAGTSLQTAGPGYFSPSSTTIQKISQEILEESFPLPSGSGPSSPMASRPVPEATMLASSSTSALQGASQADTFPVSSGYARAGVNPRGRAAAAGMLVLGAQDEDFFEVVPESATGYDPLEAIRAALDDLLLQAKRKSLPPQVLQSRFQLLQN